VASTRRQVPASSPAPPSQSFAIAQSSGVSFDEPFGHLRVDDGACGQQAQRVDGGCGASGDSVPDADVV
jgi:hypothetical protein